MDADAMEHRQRKRIDAVDRGVPQPVDGRMGGTRRIGSPHDGSR
jgi:hypothetical protein